MSTKSDLLTTILGFIVAFLTAILGNMQSIQTGEPINWLPILLGAVIAAFGWLTNKTGTKPPIPPAFGS